MDETKPTGPPPESYMKKSGVNYANEAPKEIKRKDAAHIDNQLNVVFVKGHCHNVHAKHMDLVRGNARHNARRKIP